MPTDSPSKLLAAELRVFAGLQFLFWGLIAWSTHARIGVRPAVAIVISAGCLAVIGLVRPAAIRGFQRRWLDCAAAMNWLVSQLLLGCLYFGLIFPVGLTLRGLRRDPLQRRWPAPQDTGWHARSPPGDTETYLRQY